MAFSMHSHSGQFCPGHAKDQLEAIVQKAISLKMRAFAFTEHMPRIKEEDLYPEELSEGQTVDQAVAALFDSHKQYVTEAVRLRRKYKNEIKIIVGFEGEWIRPEYAELIEDLMQDLETDFFIGSVHHMHNIPIDYDKPMYVQAREISGGTDQQLFEDYFDAQYAMLTRLKPRVVGHFDLIRLLSEDPNRDLKTMAGVWEKVTRNLDLVQRQGGLLEINSSALRKGLKEPYPTRSICEYFLGIDGHFTLSDDSHGIPQVGLNFSPAISFLKSVNVKKLHFLERGEVSLANKKADIVVQSVEITQLDVDHHPSS